jgi:hypothetical protein
LRKSAIECYSILHYQYGRLSKSNYDVYLSYCYNSTRTALPQMIFHRLTQKGLKVFFKQPETELLTDDGPSEIPNCRCFVPLACSEYQDSTQCMHQLREAKGMSPARTIVPVFVEPVFTRERWCGQELSYLLQLRSASLVSFDVGSLAADELWVGDEGPSADTVAALHDCVDALARFLLSSNLE